MRTSLVAVLIAAAGLWLAPPADAATFVVNNAGNNGDFNTSDGICADFLGNCTLRAAIDQANADSVSDTINFAVGITTINSGALSISEPVQIIAPAYVTEPIVHILGSFLTDAANCRFENLGISDSFSGITVQSVGISGTAAIVNNFFGRAGTLYGPITGQCINLLIGGNTVSGNRLAGCGTAIEISSSSNTVDGNTIGFNAIGMPFGSTTGINLLSGSANMIGTTAANVIANCGGNGITIAAGVIGTIVANNRIGTRADGLTAAANAGHGVSDSGTNTSIHDNVISASQQNGVDVGPAYGGGGVIENNIIGLGADRVTTGLLANGLDGVSVQMNQPLTIRGNLISQNQRNGVNVNLGSPDVLIENNIIGTDGAGLQLDLLGNVADGIRTDGPRTIIRGNTVCGHHMGVGVRIRGADAVLEGNTIGLGTDGSTVIGNGSGVRSESSATGTRVGGPLPAARNVISGNSGDGVAAIGFLFTNVIVQGNRIGTNAAGTVARSNSGIGVRLQVQQALVADNLIAASGGGAGIEIQAASAAEGVITGNIIGLDVSGNASPFPPNLFANNGVGIRVINPATVGGSTPAARNVISGNIGYGIDVGPIAGGSVIEGNYIGVSGSGLVPVGNAQDGIRCDAPNVRIASNVISANLLGIFLDSGATDALVTGNIIGLDANGAADLGNQSDGILVASARASMTHSTGTPGNVISGNGGSGINLNGNDALIRGNIIGTDILGTVARGNDRNGIEAGGSGATIGGPASADRNLISGHNGFLSVAGIVDGGAVALIQGNFIGTNLAGNAAIPNKLGIQAASSGLVIADNVVSGNDGDGIDVFGTGITMRGNIVGLNSGATASLENRDFGIAITGNGNTIGNATPGGRNVISGNNQPGINVVGSNNIIQGNFIGTDGTGNAAIPNNGSGIDISGAGANNNLIGGTTAGARNVISGNEILGGVTISGDGASANRIEGNYIGVGADGTTAVPNINAGVIVATNDGTATGNVIGGTAAGAGNLIAANFDGIFVVRASSTVIQGNTVEANVGRGITVGANFLSAGMTTGTVIGGTAAGAANSITANGATGIVVEIDALSTLISRNSIFANSALGVDLNANPLNSFGDGVTANDPLDPDTGGGNNLQNFPVITSAVTLPTQTTISGTFNSTASTAFTLEFFSNPISERQGRTFIGSAPTTTDAAGNSTFVLAFPTSVTAGHFVTATATDPASNTSEFAADVAAVSPAIDITKLTNGTNNDVPPGPIVPVGSTVTFTYSVTNPGAVSLSAVVVRDDNGTPGNPADDFNATFVGGDGNTNGLLDPGETFTYTASRFATAGQYTNVATATATVPPAGTITDSNPDNHFGAAPGINVVKRTNGTDNDAPPGPVVPVGSTVTFTYVVTNTGNVALSAVVVRDDSGTPGNPADDFNAALVGGDTNTNGLLDISETWTFTASRIATPGQYTNVATANGTPPVGPPVTDTNPDNHFGGTAGINVVKLTNGTDNDAPTGPVVPVGNTVTFTYVVTNTGNVALSAVVARDDNGTPGNAADDFNATFVGGDTNTNGLLDISETWTYTASRIATAGQYSNVATVTGTPPTGPPVSDTNPDNHFGAAPGINMVKLTNGTDNDAPPGVVVLVGSTVTFTYVVTNTGNVSLSAVVTRDDNGTPGNPADDFNATLASGDTNGNGLLDITETWTFTASRIATAGQYTNVGSVSGTPPSGPPVTDTNPDNHFGGTAGINVVKLTNGTDHDAPPGVFVPVGSTVTFTYVVTNMGTVSLSAVVVRDDNGTPGNAADDFNATFAGGDANGNGLLDVSETWTLTATRIATAGQHSNVATASGTPPSGPPVSDTNPDNHFGAAAAIDVTKLTNGTDNNAAPGPTVSIGSTVTFTYVVTNAGNVSLSGAAVRDDNGTAGNAADDFNATFVGGDTNGNSVLDLGETFTFTSSRIATAGQYTNVGTATGTPPAGSGPAVSASDVDNHFGGSAPVLYVPTLDPRVLLLLAMALATIAALELRA